MGARERRGATHSLRPVGIRIRADLSGRLSRRYKRFLADIETDAGEKITVHCPDPGSMRGTALPGARVRCSTSDNPKRKLRHTLEMIRNGRIWVGVHPGRANDLAARAISSGAIEELSGYAVHEREVVARPGSRLDFRLSGHSRDSREAWIEVKSVSMAEGDTALFPDSVTTRGRKHLETLLQLHRQGARAALVYLVQRADCERVETAETIDPSYADALHNAARSGVEVFALGARITGREIRIERRLPVVL